MNRQAWEELNQELDDLERRIERIEVEAKAGNDVFVSNQYVFMSGYLINLKVRISNEKEKRSEFATRDK